MLDVRKWILAGAPLATVLGAGLAHAAAPAQLKVFGVNEDGAACTVARIGSSFSLPHAVSCSGLPAGFSDMGTAFTSAHALHSTAPTSAHFSAAIPALMPGEFVAAVLEWERADSRLDLCVAATAHSAAACTGASERGTEPARVLIIGNPATASANTAAQTVELEARLAGGGAPARVSLALEDHGAHAIVTGASDHSMGAHDNQAGQVDVNLDLNPTTINVGQSAMLMWTSTNADSCAESGAWTNPNAPLSGQQTVTPSSAGSYSYTMTCVNADSQSMETQVLTVLTPSSGGGGGGSIDALALALLAALGGIGLLRSPSGRLCRRVALSRARPPRRSPRAS